MRIIGLYNLEIFLYSINNVLNFNLLFKALYDVVSIFFVTILYRIWVILQFFPRNSWQTIFILTLPRYFIVACNVFHRNYMVLHYHMLIKKINNDQLKWLLFCLVILVLWYIIAAINVNICCNWLIEHKVQFENNYAIF